jgi:hypothetical protein
MLFMGQDTRNGRGLSPVLAMEDKFINVTLKKAVDRVELEPSQSLVSNPSTGLGTAV